MAGLTEEKLKKPGLALASAESDPPKQPPATLTPALDIDRQIQEYDAKNRRVT